MPFLKLQDLTLRIGDNLLCRDLNFEIAENECWGLLGKNGAGKTTLLHSLIGIRKIESGKVFIEGKNLDEFSRPELATRVGILFQDGVDVLPATVLETVMLGRHPHVQSLLRDDPSDIDIALGALTDLSLEKFAQRQIDSLSGGERQRLALAMLITQAPQLFLLDEPSNHLDVAFQVRLLNLLKQKIAERGASLLMATHDINLAARFCEKIILLMNDGEYLAGNRQQVLTEENLSVAYNCSIRSITERGITLFYPV